MDQDQMELEFPPELLAACGRHGLGVYVETAWAYRDATYASVFAGVDADPANASTIRDWSVGYHEALHPVLRRRRLREHDDGRGRGAGSAPAIATTTTGWRPSSGPTTRTTCSASTRTSSRHGADLDGPAAEGRRAAGARARPAP